MSLIPTLWPLGADLTRITAFQCGRDALRQGDRLAARGSYEQAAAMYRVAQRAAEQLAAAAQPIDPKLARRCCMRRGSAR